MTLVLEGLLFYLVLGVIGGTVSEQVAKRKWWPPQGWLGAVLIGFGGALIFSWFFGYVLGFKEPNIWYVPIIPAILGVIVFLIPYFMVRGGYTSYGKDRTWMRKYKR